MKDYVKENQRILEAWEKEYINKGYDVYFTPDGIMYRGPLVWDGKNWRHDVGGNENELWSNAPIRILFLTKDQNGGVDHDDCWDVRGDSYHHPDSEKEENRLYNKYAFNANIVRILYGLVSTNTNKMVDFDYLDDSEALKVADVVPFARINCKKETGGPQCPYDVLDKALKEFRPNLTEQILNLDADIFVCCGCFYDTNPILDFLNTIGYNFQYTNDGSYSVYYDSEKNKIAISLYHLSYRSYSRRAMYEDAIIPYYNFIKQLVDTKGTDFIESHRK